MTDSRNARANFHRNENYQNGYMAQNNRVLKPHRQWTRTTYGRRFRYDNRGQPFILMSYNILAQSLLERHSYLYGANDSRFLNWSHRLDCITKEILAARPAILCLQEVQDTHLTEIEDALAPMQYAKPLYKKRTSHDYDDGCAIFYNPQYFQLIDYHYVEYFQPNVKASRVCFVDDEKHSKNYMVLFLLLMTSGARQI